ncbi:hypothetical protein KQX54_011492 [Cotesia glomerata]|uniref:Uncharacterized protein n=1 Tax=Cotesia glomerata TaxID=32391 RepID=A0AAV7IK60_COTGL|nr:hypothetical protein KQX54_011492 [Cotesia glomerata]
MFEMDGVKDAAKAENLRKLFENAQKAIKAYQEAREDEPSTPQILTVKDNELLVESSEKKKRKSEDGKKKDDEEANDEEGDNGEKNNGKKDGEEEDGKEAEADQGDKANKKPRHAAMGKSRRNWRGKKNFGNYNNGRGGGQYQNRGSSGGGRYQNRGSRGGGRYQNRGYRNSGSVNFFFSIEY